MSLSVIIAVIVTLAVVCLFPQVVGFLITGAMLICRAIASLVGALLGKD